MRCTMRPCRPRWPAWSLAVTERADLVVLGGGLAGLSLAMRLVQSGYGGSVRIIEPRERYVDDRSWSFWMPEGALPAAPVTRTWDRWLFSREGGEPVVQGAEGWRYAYVRGSDIDAVATNGPSTTDGKEHEFFNLLSYKVQSGPAKDLNVRLRTSSLRVSSDAIGYNNSGTGLAGTRNMDAGSLNEAIECAHHMDLCRRNVQ